MKVGAAGKSSFFCNNIHSPVGSFKKLLCLINAHGCNVNTKSLDMELEDKENGDVIEGEDQLGWSFFSGVKLV